jgi:hypothetical protein
MADQTNDPWAEFLIKPSPAHDPWAELVAQPRKMANPFDQFDEPPGRHEEVAVIPDATKSLNAIVADFEQAVAAAAKCVMSEIDQFKSALDDKGNPLHPHFDELEEAMALLVQSALATNTPAPPLKDLYVIAMEMATATRH